VLWAQGPAAAGEAALAPLSRAYAAGDQPAVTVPAPVQAVLEPGTWPPVCHVTSCLTRILACQSVDDKEQPQGVADSFPAGLTRLGVWFQTADAPPDTTLLLQWYTNGHLLRVHQAFRISTAVSKFVGVAAVPGKTLRAGDWKVEFYQNGVKVAEKTFTVAGAAGANQD
jgi:hypothetical protein